MLNNYLRYAIFISLIELIFLYRISAQSDSKVKYSVEDDGLVYTSLEAALSSDKPVYRLKITKLKERDSLPEEIFDLVELRELTVKGCRLCVLNRNIELLQKLEVLNLDRNKLLRLPETIGNLSNLRYLKISRNIIETLPESVGKLNNLKVIDAWDNPLYVLPDSIYKIANTLETLDLRQVPLTKWEYELMVKLLPYTDILFTDICECENRREHN